MKRLVILARKLDPGGAERQLTALARGLKQRGRDVHVVLFYGGGIHEAALSSAGVPMHFVGKRGRWDAAGFMVRLALLLRGLRPDVIYSFLDVPNILSALLRPAIGRPRLIWSIRAAGMEMRHYDWLSRMVVHAESSLGYCADGIIANSFAGLEWAERRGFPAERIQVIENGIDTEYFQRSEAGRAMLREEWGISATVPLVGIVGRLDPMKDYPNFLAACARLLRAHAAPRFVCVGGGRAEVLARLRAFADAQGMGDRVVWAGVRGDMPSVLSALDIFVSASAFGEGFPNVVGEAMSCGVPCVVTDVGDSARIVDGLGVVVPARDAEALADAMGEMINRLRQAPGLGLRGREQIVSRYSLERMVDRTERWVFG